MSKDTRTQVNAYMNSPMSDWPPALYDTCYNVSQRIGVSGDMLADVIEVWLEAGNGKEMSYAEYLAACKEQE